jgi:hypothetical protein
VGMNRIRGKAGSLKKTGQDVEIRRQRKPLK